MSYCPTPAEIKAACEEIQAEWSDEERERRCVGPGRQAWVVPGLDAGHEVVDRETVTAFTTAK